jgi:hypothetical protein
VFESFCPFILEVYNALHFIDTAEVLYMILIGDENLINNGEEQNLGFFCSAQDLEAASTTVLNTVWDNSSMACVEESRNELLKFMNFKEALEKILSNSKTTRGAKHSKSVERDELESYEALVRDAG